MNCTNHIPGHLVFNESTRRCIVCGEKMIGPATLQTHTSSGRMEEYPGILFKNWPKDRIRRQLGLGENCVILHNWENNTVYVFRANNEPEEIERAGEPRDNL
jgi:hypothetical protein